MTVAMTLDAAWRSWSYESAKRLGHKCPVCNTDVVDSPGGSICLNKHGGV